VARTKIEYFFEIKVVCIYDSIHDFTSRYMMLINWYDSYLLHSRFESNFTHKASTSVPKVGTI
jgi:hypothetical protein